MPAAAARGRERRAPDPGARSREPEVIELLSSDDEEDGGAGRAGAGASGRGGGPTAGRGDQGGSSGTGARAKREREGSLADAGGQGRGRGGGPPAPALGAGFWECRCFASPPPPGMLNPPVVDRSALRPPPCLRLQGLHPGDEPRGGVEVSGVRDLAVRDGAARGEAVAVHKNVVPKRGAAGPGPKPLLPSNTVIAASVEARSRRRRQQEPTGGISSLGPTALMLPFAAGVRRSGACDDDRLLAAAAAPTLRALGELAPNQAHVGGDSLGLIRVNIAVCNKRRRRQATRRCAG